MTSRRAACAIDADELSIKFALAHLAKSHVHCYEFSVDALGQVGEACTMDGSRSDACAVEAMGL